MQMSDCKFCSIAKGQGLDEEIVFENDACFVLLDKYRVTSAGAICLVVTKRHFSDITELDDSISEILLTTIKKTAILSKTTFRANGVRIWQANGKAAGQSIFHLHFHIVPCNSVWDRLIALFPVAFDLLVRHNIFSVNRSISNMKRKKFADSLRHNYEKGIVSP
jgi:histidine triad (HIT) family protein